MDNRVTLAEVADEAGVSAMTVSNVLNGRPGASDETRKRVLEVAEALGYVPHAAARQLKGSKTGLIGVLTLDLTNTYGLEIIRGIADELASLEFEALINVSYHDAVRERERIDFMARGLTDGLLLVAPVLEEQTVELIKRRRTPVVVIDPRRTDVELARVTADNYHGARAATEHLIGLGHTRIAYLGGLLDLESSTIRFNGYRDAMRLAGLAVDERLVGYCDFTYPASFRLASQIIEDHHPTAIQTGGDLIALGAVDAARKHGLHVPDDISVVGFDDLPQAGNSFPGLTTVSQSLHDMGQVATRMLISILERGRPVAERIEMPTSLIVRGTAAPPPEAPSRPPVRRARGSA